jgi:hypothetical protein
MKQIHYLISRDRTVRKRERLLISGLLMVRYYRRYIINAAAKANAAMALTQTKLVLE